MTTASDAENGWRTEDTYYCRATDRSPSEAVVRAVAAASDRNCIEPNPDDESVPLESLYGTIDPDALDALFRDAGDESRTGAVEFAYCGYDVTVRSTGLVTVTEREP
jgi:hypothetical protein